MDGKNRELTPEEEAAELAKPGAHPEWETNLPADLQKAIQDYLESIRNQVTYLDCLWDELYGSINASQWGWEISKEQADYLRAKVSLRAGGGGSRRFSADRIMKHSAAVPQNRTAAFLYPAAGTGRAAVGPRVALCAGFAPRAGKGPDPGPQGPNLGPCQAS